MYFIFKIKQKYYIFKFHAFNPIFWINANSLIIFSFLISFQTYMADCSTVHKK